jgi:hypothetical protein
MERGLLFCFSWIWFAFPSPLVTKFGFCSSEGSDLGPLSLSLSLSLFVPSFHLLLGVLINEVFQVQFSSPFHACLFLVSSISIPLWVWWVLHQMDGTFQAAAPLVHRVYNAHALQPGHYTTLITTRLVDLIFWRETWSVNFQ